LPKVNKFTGVRELYLVSAEEIKKVDEAAIGKLGIPGIVLMENAGLRVVEMIENLLGEVRGKKIALFAGKGNNGGDGFVIARHLINMGAEVKVMLLGRVEQVTGDAKINLEILIKMGVKIFILDNENAINVVRVALVYTDLVVDAIYGTGFKGMVSNQLGSIIEVINSCQKTIIAVDIPSGVEASTGKVNGPCIKATHTITFSYPKIGLLLFPASKFVGQLEIANISIPETAVKELGLKRYLVTGNMVNNLVPPRETNGHKGSYGKVLILGGSVGLTGAPAMAGVAALRIGAGLVTIGLPKSLNSIMEVKVTEVMTKPLPETEAGTLSSDSLQGIRVLAQEMDAIAIGPGMGINQEIKELVPNLIKSLTNPLVLDADSLNALVDNLDSLQEKKGEIIITPHPGEMARLLGVEISHVEKNRLSIAEKAAQDWGVIVVLKGYRTIIACPDGTTYINPTGNPGLATGGSGDVLTGIIAGLIGQGLSPKDGAVAGVYFHGYAGDLLAQERGMMSIMATDILEILNLVTKKF
jgi:ADP-dependent NAD(P)H-hydrate dehydratase / NAD(P)H-hydrate epimerase